MGVSKKNGGKPPKIDGENNGRPLLKWMIWGERGPLFFGNIHKVVMLGMVFSLQPKASWLWSAPMPLMRWFFNRDFPTGWAFAPYNPPPARSNDLTSRSWCVCFVECVTYLKKMLMRPPKIQQILLKPWTDGTDGKIIETEVPGLFFYNLFSHIAFAFLVTWEALSPSSWEA